MKKETHLHLVIDFLDQGIKNLEEEIKLDKGSSQEKIELRSQMIAAIGNLKFCSEHGLNASQVDVIRIPEGGSESYFTEYLIVDEKELNNIPTSSIVRKDEKEIQLNCFDLIIRKKTS